MRNSDVTPATTHPGTRAAHIALSAGPSPLGVSDVDYGVLDRHRTAVAPSPEWRLMARRLGTALSALMGRVVDVVHFGAPRRA